MRACGRKAVEEVSKMGLRNRIRGLVLLVAVAASLAGGLVLLASPPAEAARRCWVMVCSDTACWEVCKKCPTSP